MTTKADIYAAQKAIDAAKEFDMVLELADLLGVSPSEVIRLFVNDNGGSAGYGEK